MSEALEHRRTAQIATLKGFCTRARGAECRRCELACPADAVSFDASRLPVIDADACTLCGICLGICDAFTSKHVTMEDVHERFVRIAKRGEEVVVTCEENLAEGARPAANVVVVPCLAALAPEFWTVVLAENMTVRIALDFKRIDCRKCSRAGELGEALYTRAVETAESYTERTVGYQRVVPEREDLVKDYTNPADVDRRGAFESMADDVVGIATGKRRLRNSKVLNDYVTRREKARAQVRLRLAEGVEHEDFAPAGQRRRTLWPKRKFLLAAIESEPSVAARVPLLLSHTDAQRCRGTQDCVEACPTGARQPAEEGRPATFLPRYCIACGLCVAACPEHAVELEECTGADLRA